MLKRKSSRVILKCLRTISISLLLLLYVVGNVQIESIHQVFHSFETALHSTDQEKDPCHRAIYHEATDDGCDHSTHFTAVKNCPLCHVVPVNESLLVHSSTVGLFVPENVFDEQAISTFNGSITDYLPARAPPFIRSSTIPI
jgi:hypothetical protein